MVRWNFLCIQALPIWKEKNTKVLRKWGSQINKIWKNGWSRMAKMVRYRRENLTVEKGEGIKRNHRRFYCEDA